MNTKIPKLFEQIIINSLSTPQVAYLGGLLDRTFNIHKAAGLSPKLPIPRQTAAAVLLSYFSKEDDILRLFSILLAHEGDHFYDRELVIWGRDDFIRVLALNKWIFDRELKQFFIDPFYEHDINFLKSVRVIDLREKKGVSELIKKFISAAKKMSVRDLDWRITLRLYDLDMKNEELIRKIIDLLLSRQDLQSFSPELFFCLKELAVNASKANYKKLYQKQQAIKHGGRTDEDYGAFLEQFKQEIEENGNKNLLKLAKKNDRFITIVFQSSLDDIEVWVVNDQSASVIEKQQILKVVAPDRLDSNLYINDDYTEGAGLGLTILLNILKKHSNEQEPLKVIFYPEFIKIGFKLLRADLLREMKIKAEQAAASAVQKSVEQRSSL